MGDAAEAHAPHPHCRPPSCFSPASISPPGHLTIPPSGRFVDEKFTITTANLVFFGIAKAVMNFVTGVAADKFGRRNAIILGWIFGLPMPFMVIYASDWWSVAFSSLFLGIQQVKRSAWRPYRHPPQSLQYVASIHLQPLPHRYMLHVAILSG